MSRERGEVILPRGSPLSAKHLRRAVSDRKPLTRERMLEETGLKDMLDTMKLIDPAGTEKVLVDLDRVVSLYNIATHDAEFTDSTKILKMSMGAQKCLAQIALGWVKRGYEEEGHTPDPEMYATAAFMFGMCWGYALREMDLEDFDD